MLDIGEVIGEGRYRILDILGRGGMATVYLAADARLGDRPVAIKEMDAARLSPADQTWAIAAFQREAEVLAGLGHRGIAKVNDKFDERGYWYLVMEYVAGETLQDALQRAGRFSEAQVLDWAGQLAVVLDYLHGQDPQIIFRDLKPSNVMVQADGKLKLIDFGIVRFFKPEQKGDTINLGTPGYAAPEQYREDQTDPRSDVYSLAVLLHQLLTGFDPANSPMHLPPVQRLRPDLSPAVAEAINQALQPDPASRFNTVMAFANALGAPFPGPTTPADMLEEDRQPLTGLVLWMRQHRGVVYAVAAVLILALLALILFKFVLDGTPSTKASQTATAEAVAEITASVLTETAAVESTGTAAAQQSATAAAIAAASATATPTDTATPTPSATATATPTPSPTHTPSPSPTPTPTTPPPTPCSNDVSSRFQNIYQNAADRLGCPVNSARSVGMAQQTFERGRMIWRGDRGMIYVLYGGGGWGQYRDIWNDSMPHLTCNVPDSSKGPVRGFGAIWCTYDNVRNGVGNATAYEWGETNIVQDFAGGSIIQDSNGRVYTFLSDNGTWR